MKSVIILITDFADTDKGMFNSDFNKEDPASLTSGICSILGQSSPPSWHRLFSSGQLLIIKVWRLVGSPSSGKDVRFEHECICNCWRQDRLCNFRDSNLWQNEMWRRLSTGGRLASSGNSTTIPHASTVISLRGECVLGIWYNFEWK